jgi:hypothetical protein
MTGEKVGEGTQVPLVPVAGQAGGDGAIDLDLEPREDRRHLMAMDLVVGTA